MNIDSANNSFDQEKEKLGEHIYVHGQNLDFSPKGESQVATFVWLLHLAQPKDEFQDAENQNPNKFHQS